MLVAVIITLVILSFTGVAVLEVAHTSRSASMGTAANIKLQYEVESTISEALWRINIGEDSLVNFDQDGVTCTWDANTEILSVNIDNGNLVSAVELDLSDDTHFQRGIASSNTIQTNQYDTGIEEEKRLRIFNFLPTVDLQYFIDNKVSIHNGNQMSWKEDSLSDEGIHIFTGNNLIMENIVINNSTLVFTGKGITFTGTNIIKAPIPLESEDALPALVFVDPDDILTLSLNARIEGAIYCAGQLNINGANLSGPVIAQHISLSSNIEIMDAEYSEYYRWTSGFGDQEDYDWPKQIGRWKTVEWKHSAG